MRKEGQFQNNNVEFADSDYQQDYTVDPLTTRDQIKSEVQEIERIRKEREESKVREQKKKADADAAELARLRALTRAGADSEADEPHPGVKGDGRSPYK